MSLHSTLGLEWEVHPRRKPLAMGVVACRTTLRLWVPINIIKDIKLGSNTPLLTFNLRYTQPLRAIRVAAIVPTVIHIRVPQMTAHNKTMQLVQCHS